MADPEGQVPIPQGWEARRAVRREIPWLRRRHHFYHRNGPSFRSVREAAILLGYARYVWSPLRWAEWGIVSIAAVVLLWFMGDNGLALEAASPFLVIPIAVGVELYRTKRLAERATEYLASHDALPATSAPQRSVEPPTGRA